MYWFGFSLKPYHNNYLSLFKKILGKENKSPQSKRVSWLLRIQKHGSFKFFYNPTIILCLTIQYFIPESNKSKYLSSKIATSSSRSTNNIPEKLPLEKKMLDASFTFKVNNF